jgi:squalene synthase HpnC
MNAGAGAPPAAIRLARSHYENFPVVSWVLPRELRLPLARVYAFARTTDDLGDEGAATPAERLEALDAWEAGLRDALGSGGSRGPAAAGVRGGSVPSADAVDPRRRILRETAETIRGHDLPLQPFLDMIDANRLDQKQSRYRTMADLLGSCRLSANPIGRIVLRLFGRDDEALHESSDAVCTGLQIANHIQGAGDDIRLRGRVYLPLEDLERFGVAELDLITGRPAPRVRELLRFEIDRARTMLERGRRLPEAFTGRRRAVLRLFVRGGTGILDRLESRLDDVLRERVRVPRASLAMWLAAEGARAWTGGGRRVRA